MILPLKQWFLTTCCLVLLMDPVLAGKPGSGGGTRPPPVLPNVRYSVAVLPKDAVVSQISNSGVVIGRITKPNSLLPHAFLYDHDGTFPRLYDLNYDPDLEPIQDQLFLMHGADWLFLTAIGINDVGQVVGRLQNAITLEEKGFALDTFGLSAPASWLLLPLPELPGNRVGATRMDARVPGTPGCLAPRFDRASRWDFCVNPAGLPIGTFGF